MNKKNRFSMLEINPQDQTTNVSSALKVDTKTPETSKKTNLEMKTIIPNNEFEENLKKHKLKDQVKEIHAKKKLIESSILQIRKKAWIKIILGIYIIVLASKKYLIGHSQIKSINREEAEEIITRSTLNQDDVILILLIITFIYVTFFYKNKKDKK